MLIPDKGSFNQEKSETETVFQLKFKNKASRQPTEGFGNLIWLDIIKRFRLFRVAN